MFELTRLHVLDRRQLRFGDVVLVHVEEDVLYHYDTHFLVAPGSVEFHEESVIMSSQNSFRNWSQ